MRALAATGVARSGPSQSSATSRGPRCDSSKIQPRRLKRTRGSLSPRTRGHLPPFTRRWAGAMRSLRAPPSAMVRARGAIAYRRAGVAIGSGGARAMPDHHEDRRRRCSSTTPGAPLRIVDTMEVSRHAHKTWFRVARLGWRAPSRRTVPASQTVQNLQVVAPGRPRAVKRLGTGLWSGASSRRSPATPLVAAGSGIRPGASVNAGVVPLAGDAGSCDHALARVCATAASACGRRERK